MPSRAPARAGVRGGRRARLVVVSTFPIHPHAFGGQLRGYHVYGALAPQCDVELVSLTEPGSPARRVEIAPGFAETVVPRSAKQSWLEAEGSARSGGFVGDVLAATLTPLYTPAFLDALRVAAEGATAAILAQPFLLPSLRTVAPRLPFAYDAHNVEVQLKRSLLPESADTMLSLAAEVEGEATRGARRVFACSEEDRRGLAAEYGVDVAGIDVVPNGVDVAGIDYVDPGRRRAAERTWVEAFREGGGWEGARRVALFLGSNHMPNQEAVAHMLRVVPGLGDVLLLVAGWVGLPFMERGDAVAQAAFLGPFEDHTKRTLLRAAGVGVNPVTRGSGTNLKILEYFAAGLPVVSTAVGARGLEVRDGEHLRIAHIDHFAAAMREVLDAPDGAAAMARRARELVEKRYAWPVVSAPMRRWVGELVAA